MGRGGWTRFALTEVRCPRVPRPRLRSRGLRVRRGGQVGGERSQLAPGTQGPALPARPSPVHPVLSHLPHWRWLHPLLPGPGAAPPPAPRSRVGQPGRRLLCSPRPPAPVLNASAAPRQHPRDSSTRASLPAARPGLSRRYSAAEDTSWKINKLIPPLTPAAGRRAGGGRGIRSSPS